MTAEEIKQFYECTIYFSIPMIDENGLTIENESFPIPKKSVWERCEYTKMDGEVRLTNDELGWIEIPYKTLKNNFKPIQP